MAWVIRVNSKKVGESDDVVWLTDVIHLMLANEGTRSITIRRKELKEAKEVN